MTIKKADWSSLEQYDDERFILFGKDRYLHIDASKTINLIEVDGEEEIVRKFKPNKDDDGYICSYGIKVNNLVYNDLIMLTRKEVELFLRKSSNASVYEVEDYNN